MITHVDFRELLLLLEKHRVDYMVVGAYALGVHGFPRFTKDLDIFYRLTADNVTKLTSALVEHGFTRKAIEATDLSKSGDLVTFGVPPVRVDLLNTISGVSFEEAAPNVIRVNIEGVAARFIGKDDLIKNKLSTNRAKDRIDIENLP